MCRVPASGSANTWLKTRYNSAGSCGGCGYTPRIGWRTERERVPRGLGLGTATGPGNGNGFSSGRAHIHLELELGHDVRLWPLFAASLTLMVVHSSVPASVSVAVSVSAETGAEAESVAATTFTTNTHVGEISR